MLTPASQDFSARLELIADGTEGEFEYLQDGEVVVSGRFGIAYEDSPGNDFIVWNPAFGPFHDQQWLRVREVTWYDQGLDYSVLFMTDATVGGYESMWVKRR